MLTAGPRKGTVVGEEPDWQVEKIAVPGNAGAQGRMVGVKVTNPDTGRSVTVTDRGSFLENLTAAIEAHAEPHVPEDAVSAARRWLEDPTSDATPIVTGLLNAVDAAHLQGVKVEQERDEAVANSSITSKVRAYHRAFRLPANVSPTDDLDSELVRLRMELLDDAARQAWDAAGLDLVRFIGRLAELVYVAYGTAVCHGVDLDEVVAAVHAAKMAKLGPDGSPVLDDAGRVVIPSTVYRADVLEVLKRQRDRAADRRGC